MNSSNDLSTDPQELTETGLVTKTDGEFVWVNTASKLACGSCRVNTSCGSGILEKYLAGKVFTTQLLNTLNAKVGDQVEISIKSDSVTRAAIMAYLLPLLGLILGACAGFFLSLNNNQVSQSEWISILLSLTGLVTGLWLASRYNNKWALDERFMPKLKTIIASVKKFETSEVIQVKHL